MRVLVADNSHPDRELLQHLLSAWGHEVTVATDGYQAWEILQRNDAPPIAILDWTMPGPGGVELCKRIRARQTEAYTYVLLLTGKALNGDVTSGLQAGADDYLTKPFDSYMLWARLKVCERILGIQQALLASREEFRFAATHDALTGVWNRRGVLDCLHHELARGQREKSAVAVMVADLDHFKRVNDTLGHAAGDAVLREIAARFAKSLREYDSFGRIGGEEFLLVAPGCDEDTALRLGWRILFEISHVPVLWESKEISITCSIGVAATMDPTPQELNSLLAAADGALYRAKEGGRNRVEGASHGTSQLSAVDPTSFPEQVSVPSHVP
jgi:two-component system, cell cycle response regulator